LGDHEGDASLRSWIIELSGALEISPAELIELLSSASDPDVCQALVLAIGQTDFEQLSPRERSRIEATVAQLFRSHPDAGIHSACEWLWRHHLQAGELPEVQNLVSVAGAAAQRWFAGPHGHDFVILSPPETVTIGSPEYELWREEDEQPSQARFGYSFAMSTKEVTIGQYSAFREALANRRYSPTPDCPINNASWFDAVAYCRWLSDQEGIDESQMCYPALDEIGPGMQVPENWLSRSGYRLPTPAEWEYACRGDAPTSRFFGEGMALFPAYAYALPHSDDRTWPVGSLKPNRFGLFDILGSIAEWCQPEDIASGPIALDTLMPRRGGDFGDAIQNVRTARLTMAPADVQWANTGFRVVRWMDGR
jgi:formylglycine-generating enzyme required for sulfatase activity